MIHHVILAKRVATASFSFCGFAALLTQNLAFKLLLSDSAI